MSESRLSRRRWLEVTSALGLGLSGFLPDGVRAAVPGEGSPVRDVGSRRQLFVDSWLIDELAGARQVLHPPRPEEIVFRFDRPWEGIYSGYATVLRDGDRFRLYYRGMPRARHDLETEVTCVAESEDGLTWKRPDLDHCPRPGASTNNIVLQRHRGCHNLSPFIDTRPDCPPGERYKAMGGTGQPGLLAFTSPDGLRWKQLGEGPVITRGAFDSQNNAFWSESEGRYVCYFRVFREGFRWIARSTSEDFVHWDEPVDLGLDGQPRRHLYTNGLHPYFRAPHLAIGLPTRFFPGRRVVTDREAREIGTPGQWNFVNDSTDIVLISTRGGSHLDRTFPEAFLRPGADLRNWTSRASYAARGFLQTSERELSIYVLHHLGYPSIHLRRHALRLDGFASVRAPLGGGEMVTRPLTFEGSRLLLNSSTSAAGGIHVELQTPEGRPIPGYTLDDCREIIGDRLDHPVSWRGGSTLALDARKAIRIRFVLRDADLFALRFTGEAGARDNG